jgi:hypothetical protein
MATLNVSYMHAELSVGIDVTKQTAGTTNDFTGGEWQAGSQARGSDGSLWMYAQANEAVASIGMAVAIDETGQMLKLTAALALAGHRIGFVQAAFLDNAMGWVLLDSGRSNAYVLYALSSAVADIMLMTSATAGALDDAYTTFVPLLGVVLVSAGTTTVACTAIIRAPVLAYLRTSGV